MGGHYKERAEYERNERMRKARCRNYRRKRIYVPIPGISIPCTCHVGQAYAMSPPMFVCMHEIGKGDEETGMCTFELKPEFREESKSSRCPLCNGRGYAEGCEWIQLEYDPTKPDAAVAQLCAEAVFKRLNPPPVVVQQRPVQQRMVMTPQPVAHRSPMGLFGCLCPSSAPR